MKACSLKIFLLVIITITTNCQPPRLNNKGQSCYLNSAIQALYAVEPLTFQLEKIDPQVVYSDQELKDKIIPFIEETFVNLAKPFAQLMHAFNKSTTNPSIYDPALTAMFDATDTRMQKLTGSRRCSQQDSPEFIGQLIDQLSINNTIQDLFEISTKYLVTCDASSTKPKLIEENPQMIPDTTLNPSFPHVESSAEAINFSRLLDDFFGTDLLEIFRDYPKDSCSRQRRIYKFPPVLVIVAKRFGADYQIKLTIPNFAKKNAAQKKKAREVINFTLNNTNVKSLVGDLSKTSNFNNLIIGTSSRTTADTIKALLESYSEIGIKVTLTPGAPYKIPNPLTGIPLELNLQSFPGILLGKENPNTPQEKVVQPPVYDLVSVIVHRGEINFGHYIAYVKNNGIWYYTSDNEQPHQITEATLPQEIEQGYVFMYVDKEELEIINIEKQFQEQEKNTRSNLENLVNSLSILKEELEKPIS